MRKPHNGIEVYKAESLESKISGAWTGRACGCLLGKSVCMAVETGFDTDCNGATVGSVLGMAKGIEGIPQCWTGPVNNTINTSILGVSTVSIPSAVKKTIEHIK